MAVTSVKAMGWARSFPISGGVRTGRRWAHSHLDSLGWTTTAPDTVDDVVTTVSELITNAHLHAHSNAQVILTWDNTCLHVSVSDTSTELPTPRAPDDARSSGRGLVIVDALADAWQSHSRPDGKTITACFRLPGTPDPHPART